MTAELVLHLELDGFEVDNQKDTVKDLSGHNHAGELKGNVAIVADDAFGACANFDGDSKSYIAVPSAQSLKITGDVTVEAWVYITKAATGWVRVIGKGTFDSRSYGLWYKMTGTTITCLFQRGHARPFHDCEAVLTLPATPLNTWYHLAGVVEGKKSSLYVHDLQGKLITQRELDGAPSGALIDNDAHVTIGHDPSHAAHAGKVAQARIYKGSLSLAEIERDIGSDRLSLVPFRKSHPIDFRLNDDDDQPVLYIVDDSADAKVALVKLELTNTSPQAINIPPLASGTSRDHHHFALRFHPGTLSASTIKKLTELTIANQATVLKEAADWELACLVGATGPVTLYLSYKGAKKSLKPQEQLTLTLHGVSADAGSGSRGTQVELLPHQLTYVGDDAPITGNRMRYIHITNHRGQKNIPLHVWLVDGNNVLNDGESTTDLTLRISNGSADRDIILNKASRFVISFDIGDPGKADWALTDKANADGKDGVKVMHGKTELPGPGRGQETNDTFREWELTFPKEQVLAKRGSTNAEPLEIVLKQIKTNLSPGHANLYVRYEGIPGYWDGQFILTVEKTPLKYSQGKVDVAGALVANNGSLQVTASHRNQNLAVDSAYIGRFYVKNKSQGIGISSNGIAAIGEATGLQHLYLKPKTYAGDGAVIVEGSLRVLGGPFMVQGDIVHSGGDMQVHGSLKVRGPLQVEGGLTVKGLPIFDLGKRMKEDEWKSVAQTLKNDASYRPGSFILFVREDASDDLCCLVKKSDHEVLFMTFSRSGKTETI